MLPAGYTVRHATDADAAVIFELLASHDVPLIGQVDATLDDIVDELNEPDFDPATDGWLVHSSAGQLVGWGWACRKGDSDSLDIDAYTRPGHDRVESYLWDRALARAAEIGRELGHTAVEVNIGMFPVDSLSRGLAAEHGFHPGATFVRMRIDHTEPVPHPGLPAGVELRHGTELDVRKDANAVRNLSFADHFGFVPKPFEEWAADREASSSHDWALVHVAYCEGEPAATIVRTNNFVSDLDCGYIPTLGTTPKYQGRGLGSFLLRYAFAEDSNLGRAGTILHVDTNPERPALRLYQNNGMRDVLTIDVWRRLLEV